MDIFITIGRHLHTHPTLVRSIGLVPVSNVYRSHTQLQIVQILFQLASIHLFWKVNPQKNRSVFSLVQSLVSDFSRDLRLGLQFFLGSPSGSWFGEKRKLNCTINLKFDVLPDRLSANVVLSSK